MQPCVAEADLEDFDAGCTWLFDDLFLATTLSQRIEPAEGRQWAEFEALSEAPPSRPGLGGGQGPPNPSFCHSHRW